MRVTVGQLKAYLDKVPDDAEVWIEYPERYGTAVPVTMIQHHGDDDSDFIECLTLGHRFFLFHHF